MIEIGDIQGGYCGLTLAGLGAEVVRIEPAQGVATRALGPFAGDDPHPERSLHFYAYNRGKKSLVLDLATADGRGHLGRLVTAADVLRPPGHRSTSRSTYQTQLPLGLDTDGVVTFRMRQIRPGWVPSVPRGRRCAPARPSPSGRHLSPPSDRPLSPAEPSHRRECS